MPMLLDAAQGKGRVLLSKLAFRGRLDPAAERLLFSLLEPGNSFENEKTTRDVIP
jgi:hypothetical protein